MVKSSKKSKKSTSNSKEEKLFNNLLKIVEQFMSGKGYTPVSFTDLMQRLSLPPQHETLFHHILTDLQEKGSVILRGEKYEWKQSKNDIVSGIIKMHARGFGFVVVDQPSPYTQDIFIPKHCTKNAVDGDAVEVLVNQEISEKGPEGKVITILFRGRTHIAGTIRWIDKNGDCIAYVPLLGAQQKVVVHSEERQLQIGDRIVMKIIDWGTNDTETTCQFSSYLGQISDPSCDIPAAIEEYELRADFGTAAIEEAEKWGAQVSQKDIKVREDLRHFTTVTIDPDTAKDFDDALSLEKDSEGVYHLGVHIADVSHYVRPGSALDKEASLRCNSTYFPNYCLPMLPGGLSENLCSLKPNVNRLTVSVLMKIDSEGNLLTYRMTRSVIKSVKRFTYREAKQVLDGEKKSPHSPTLHLMKELCHLLKKKRFERGSIEFSLPELVVVVDEKGVPYKTDYISYDITHQMVEEFMLKANELVAFDLSEKGKNLTYRIHDQPAEENLREFSFLANAFGFSLPDNPTVHDLQKLFQDAEETPYVSYLASNYIRRMRLAVYSAENIGHYGLSLTHYCHFTSPIRRYVDLVVHRILFGESDDFTYLQQVAQTCSEQERISAKAESSVVFLKKLRLLNQMNQESPHREFQAIVTRVKNFGIYFEIIDLLLEGFLHISELEEDYFIFEEEQMRLRGKNHGTIFGAGDQLTVSLQNIDFITQETKWYLISKQTSTVNPKRKKGQKHSDRSSKQSQRKRKEKPKNRNKTRNRKK